MRVFSRCGPVKDVHSLPRYIAVCLAMLPKHGALCVQLRREKTCQCTSLLRRYQLFSRALGQLAELGSR